MRRVRALRHWKQRFDPTAKFAWRKAMKYGDKTYAAGDIIPDDLLNKPTKLRRFWEARVIELAEFEAPNVKTGKAEVAKAEPKADEIVRDGSRYLVGGKKFTSMKKAKEFLAAQADENKAKDTAAGSGADTVSGATEDTTDDDFLS